MNPDDPRHGTNRGHRAHRRDNEPACDPCRAANAIYQRRQKKLRALYGSHMVSIVGSQRRVHALMRLGWSAVAIGERVGMEQSNLLRSISAPGGLIYRSTAIRISAAYEQMSMTMPSTGNRFQRVWVSRTQAIAERNGWPPPLAWDDIDDPDEQPTDWAYRAPTRAESLIDLDEQGAGISEVCRVIEATREALEVWCRRNDYGDLFSRLVAREDAGQQYRNQWTKEAS